MSFEAAADDKILELLKPKTPAQAHALRHVVGDLVVAARNGQWVSYSRDTHWYASQKRYSGPRFGYGPIMAAVGSLTEADLIENKIVAPGTHNFVRSRMQATPPLLALMADTPIVSVRHGEVLLMRDIGHNLVNYKETQQTRALRRQVVVINDYLGGIRLGIDHPVAQYGNGQRTLISPDGHICVLAETVYLRRIFCRENWLWGGRFYGSFGSFQCLPEVMRCKLLINGQVVVCLDFSAMHTFILYNLAGIKMDGHPYEIAGFSRDEVKFGLNIALNAKTLHGAKAALAAKWAEQNGREFASKEEHARAGQVIEAIREKHSAIASAFGSDSGVDIQFQDSEIIRAVLIGCIQEGIPALPVHDEVITPARYAGRVAELMLEAFMAKVPGPNKPILRVQKTSRACTHKIANDGSGLIDGRFGSLSGLTSDISCGPESARDSPSS